MNKNFYQAKILASFFEEVSSLRDINMNFIHYNNNHFLQRFLFKCPACLADLQYIGSFSPKSSFHPLTPIYFCSSCGSIRTPQYINMQKISRNDKEFSSVNNFLDGHLKFESRNRKLAQMLLTAFDNLFTEKIKLILEVGSGPGWLLHEAQLKGIRAIGYDLSTDSVEYGIKNLNLDLRNEIFDLNAVEKIKPIVENYIANQLVICFMVIEHIQNPDELCQSIAYYCKEHQAPALISVPITEDLSDIVTSLIDIKDAKSLFTYAPGHTCHYTQTGFVQLWKRHGATQVKRLTIPGSWPFLFLVEFN